jgi:hypothetical protein
MTPVSEIKLIRTDTTLDLSQKAEKVWGVRFCAMNKNPTTRLQICGSPITTLGTQQNKSSSRRDFWHTYLARSWELLP